MSEPLKCASHAWPAVAASMSPADKAMAAPGVPCRSLVRSNTAGSKLAARHAHQHARGRSGAGKDAGDHADERAEVDGGSKRGDPRLVGKVMHGAGGLAQLRGFAAKAQHFRVRAQHEENPGQDCALQHGARNRAQRVARLASQAWLRFRSRRS